MADICAKKNKKNLSSIKTDTTYSMSQTTRREKQKRILGLFGKIHWDGDLAEMRKS